MVREMKPYKIFAKDIENSALEQFYSAMQQDFVVRGALMPDAHTGYSLPIGAVVATDGFVLPAWVGYDIGCGMCAVPTSFSNNEIEKHAESVFNSIYRAIPVGFNHNKSDTDWDYFQQPRTKALDSIFCKKRSEAARISWQR